MALLFRTLVPALVQYLLAREVHAVGTRASSAGSSGCPAATSGCSRARLIRLHVRAAPGTRIETTEQHLLAVNETFAR